MLYKIDRHAHDLVWVTMQGHLAMEHAERYIQEIWRTLNECPRPTDLLVDGRMMQSAHTAARQRTEQVVHHPHLGHIAFVVSSQHLLLFAPLMQMLSGIGMFGDEHTAIDFLHRTRGAPSVPSMGLPTMPARAQETRLTMPPPPPQSHGLAGMLDSWSNSLRQMNRNGDRE
ncbi:STAS/SEC14 domain-containing protein [Candidatus Oscillochloris fontis]|uniref:STAS/SEC14 domain-containing protein n=1 Tax=Candidatus Oscillochloris fontis TaxID=2496868 RepID=UPI00101D672D|nr:STAS/SEC14 domain-containing protein [Candidatus Oscillochloris fontis]